MLDLYKIGNRIALLRREKGLTGEKLAEALGVSPQAVSKWENGKNLPETALLPALAALLEVSIDSILIPQELVILDARYTCGDSYIVVTDALNREVEGNSLTFKAKCPIGGYSLEGSAVFVLTVKYQTPDGMFYAFSPQGETLELSLSSKLFTANEGFDIIGAYYGVGSRYKSVMEKMRHYDYFKWDEIYVNHETFPSSPGIDESEYLTLVYMNKDGIHVISCEENGVLRYSNGRTSLEVKDTSSCILPGVMVLEWETPNSDPQNIMPCTWAGALYAALKYMGEDYTYARLMGLSGACWRITFCDAWDWSATDALVAFSYDDPLYRAIGYTSVWACRLDKDERKVERRRIVADILNGKPVVAINLRVAAEWGVITGYKDNGKTFYCRTYFDADKLNEDNDYLESENWPFLITHFGEKQEKLTKSEALIGSLRAFVESFEEKPRSNYFQGKQGYEKWIEGLRNDSIWSGSCPQSDLARRFDVHLSTVYHLIDSRRCAVEYLTECYSFTNREVTSMLKEIAGSCGVFAERLHSFKEELLKSGVSCFLGKDIGRETRNKQACLLEEALLEELKNVETAKKVIKALETAPKNTVCQVCGSPLNDDCYSAEADGSVNEKYCKWCYIDGVHKYHSPQEVIDDVVPKWNWGTPEQMSDWLRKKLETLEYWREAEQSSS
ncbi:MAG: zinc ribbon domain-containing protein [Eubacteriales bacterium]